MIFLPWSWSSNPSDWAVQIGALSSATGAVFTAAYVWLTYRLLKTTLRANDIASRSVLRSRHLQLLPITIGLKALREALWQFFEGDATNKGIPVFAAGLASALHQLDSATSTTYAEVEGLAQAIESVRTEAGAIETDLGGLLGDGAGSNGKLRPLRERAVRAVRGIDSALSRIENELLNADRADGYS